MSSTNQLMNNNTLTSNSRSSKKSSKKPSASESVAQSETVILTPVKDVEITVSVTTSISPIEDAIDAQTTDTTPPSEPKPVVNIWKLREQAREAEEALLVANKAIQKMSKETEKPKSKPNPKSKPAVVSTSESSELDAAPAATSVPEDEGWTAVTYPKKAQGKSVDTSDKSKTFVKSDKPKFFDKSDKSKSFDKSDKPKSFDKSDKPKSFDKSDKPKSFVKFKEPSAEQVAARERKNAALLVAQDQLIAACLGQMPPKTIERIDTDLSYIKDYRRTQVMKFDDDSVIAEVEGEKFEFSRSHFFENRVFQNKMREKFETLLPMAWIRFFPGRDENTYCVGISKRRDFVV
jgi:hypothetical protein